MKRTTRFTREQVRAAITAALAASDGTAFQWKIIQAANTSLNGEYDEYDHPTEGQVTRELARMVQADELVKVSRGERGPDGVLLGRCPRYWFPETYTAAEARAAEEDRIRGRVTARWCRIHDELEVRGFTPVTERGMPVRLSSASWHKLLGLDPGTGSGPDPGLPGPDQD